MNDDLDLEQLFNKSIEILRREINNLFTHSTTEKLSPTDARDLVQYIKLLSEIKAEQDEAIKKLSDEELLDVSTKALNDQTHDKADTKRS